MLLTVCWNLSLVLGRVDIVNGEGRDEQVGEYSFKSFINQVLNAVIVACIFIMVFGFYSKQTL